MGEAKTAIVINGRDNTAKAFSSVAARASSCAGQLRGILGGALAAAGIGLGIKGIYDSVNELGHLSDISLKANTSVEDLTRTVTAMNVLGIQNMGIDQFAKAMDYMQKTTGRTGIEGFYQTIESLAKIEDRAKRGQEAMRIFGRTGMEFMPLINAAENGTAALRGLIDVMPGISQSAADSGDSVADAMTIASAGVKSIWLRGIGAICGYFDKEFTGGVRQAAVMACNWMEYYAKVGASRVVYYYGMARNAMEEIGTGIGTFIGALSEGASVKDAIGMASNEYSNLRQLNLNSEAEEKASLEARQAAWLSAYDERRAKIADFSANVANAAKSADNRGLTAKDPAAAAASAISSTAIRNSLIMAGSNAAAKLEAFGPSYQNESKKQTKLLEKIANNTAAANADAANLEIIE